MEIVVLWADAIAALFFIVLCLAAAAIAALSFFLRPRKAADDFEPKAIAIARNCGLLDRLDLADDQIKSLVLILKTGYSLHCEVVAVTSTGIRQQDYDSTVVWSLPEMVEFLSEVGLGGLNNFNPHDCEIRIEEDVAWEASRSQQLRYRS